MDSAATTDDLVPQISAPAEAPLVALTDEQREQNERAIAALVAVIADGEAVALVGAGSSMSAGFDSWDGLVAKLEDRAQAHVAGGSTPSPTGTAPPGVLARAQLARDRIVAAIGPQGYHDDLGRLFHRASDTLKASITPFHRDLVALPFRALLTTNYDDVLETALALEYPHEPPPARVAIWNADQRLVSPAVRAIAVAGSPRSVLHLHGVYSIGPSIVLCADDYAEAYGIPALALRPAIVPDGAMGNGPATSIPTPPSRGSRPSHRPTRLFLLVAGLLATRRVVFVGFGLTDPYFSEVLEQVSDALWDWDSAVHFAILPITASRAPEAHARARQLKSTLGIETVFYEVVNGDYTSERDALIARIRREVDARRERPRAQQDSARAGSTAPADPGGSRAETSRARAAVPMWVQTTNTAQQRKRSTDAD